MARTAYTSLAAVALMVLACLVSAPAVGAAPLDADERRSVELAQQYWKKQITCLNFQAKVVPQSEITAYSLAHNMEPKTEAYASNDLCLMVLPLESRRKPFLDRCSLVVHEIGHVVGLRFPGPDKYHSQDPNHMMHPAIPLFEGPTVCRREIKRRVERARRARCARMPSSKRRKISGCRRYRS